ncbi:MAG TPA: Tat pathway signal sequence domain protein [Actinokineospora sp.]|nr:Tat pathway signal sequence domain protein [Actinokineospora sp.]
MSEQGVSRRAFLGWSAAAGVGALMTGGVIAGGGVAQAALAGIDDRLAAGTGWRDYLGALDLTWQKMPTGFYEGPFLGNGGLGTAVYQRSGTTGLSFTLGDSRVRDHQTVNTDPVWGKARLPIGFLTLTTAGTITSVDLRLSLHNAELSGFVHTSTGSLAVRAFVHATTDVLVVSTVVAAGTETATWAFTWQPAVSPRVGFFTKPTNLVANPAAVVTTNASGGTCVQDLASGGRTETRWTTRTEADGVTKTLVATVAHSTDHTASTTASNTMTAAAASTLDQLGTAHRTWWNTFYPKSFISVPDAKLQSFYWIQLYKMASATRAGRPVLSTSGPWLEPTPWPATWWNLNVQLEYWAINGSDHLELDSLRTALENGGPGLLASTPTAYRSDSLVMAGQSQEDMQSRIPAIPGASGAEVGDLTWALHNAWLAYRHTMDDNYLRNTVFPLLRKAINFYLHFLAKDAGGVYHLPKTYSPEYADTRDCNYDLALIHWGCKTLLAAADRLDITDTLASKWQDVLDNLVTPPQDATQGLWIGADSKLTSSHRHYSHLLGFYPLYNYDVTTNTAHRTLLETSVKHWLSFTGALYGYSFTGSGSMYASLGDGTKALTQLNTLVNNWAKPNTMYQEAGPVIETPISAAQTLHDMLLQSWGDKIRVFPAVPPTWADVTVHNLLTEGAFKVSASRKAGVTEWVRIKSLKGEPCKVVASGFGGAITVQSVGSTPTVTWSQDTAGVITINLTAGQEVAITRSTATPTMTVAPVITPTTASWGLLPASGGTPVTLAYNNDGISWNTARNNGNVDGSGYTYPAEEMPTPGIFVSGGINWKFPSYANGQNNNVTGTGQVITVPAGRYTELHVLGAATAGSATGTVTLTYTDNTTATATLSLTDWGNKPAYGEQVAVLTTHRHSSTADHSLKVRLFHQKLTIPGTVNLKSITLPVQSRYHIFAITVR